MHVNQENSATEQPLAGIPADMTTFPEMLKSQGYKTAQIGKWHCGNQEAREQLIGQSNTHPDTPRVPNDVKFLDLL